MLPPQAGMLSTKKRANITGANTIATRYVEHLLLNVNKIRKFLIYFSFYVNKRLNNNHSHINNSLLVMSGIS